MTTNKGLVAFEGYAIAKIKIYDTDQTKHRSQFVSMDHQIQRFEKARATTINNLDKLYESTLKTMGKDKAQLFATHKLMAEDLDFEDKVKYYIQQNLTAGEAVELASKDLAAMFQQMDDAYMKARAADVIEVAGNIINALHGVEDLATLQEDCIIVCDDLGSSTLMKVDTSKLKGLVLLKGNINSHVAILARALQIPTLVAVKKMELDRQLDGKLGILDCLKGQLMIEPSEQEVDKYTKLNTEYIEEVKSLQQFKGKKTLTKDGKEVLLYANIAGGHEAPSVIRNDAQGVGLFRSEFIYLEASDYPTEEEQFKIYKKIVQDLKPREVIIRTFDIGADKKVDYFDLPKEENPALGYRSIRICRDRPEMFKTQLRALYRASMFGNLSIMVPMITSVDEVLFTKKLINEVKQELTKEGLAFNDKVKVGIMIETPAAAMISDELGKHVDFFSIGTNDLIQYTLACDRLNAQLGSVFNPHHKAVLRLIKLTVDNAHKNGIICGMCGELARDPNVLPFLAAIGLDEFSCSAVYVLKVRKALSEIDTTKVDIDKYIK